MEIEQGKRDDMSSMPSVSRKARISLSYWQRKLNIIHVPLIAVDFIPREVWFQRK